MRSKKAFSLIELSIVILIIGILIAGVTQSSRLIKKSRLQTAQTLTESSPVAGMKDLALWYETSLEKSFDETAEEDGTAISIWYDSNPQTINKDNAVQNTADSQPKFMKDIFNDALPAVRFDGIDDYMDFDGTMVVGISYTIFVVEQRRSSGSPSFFIAGAGDGVTNGNLTLGYIGGGGYVSFGHFGNDLNYNIAGYTSPIARIHSFLFNTTSGKTYYLNGNNVASEPTQTEALVQNPGASLGKFFSDYYNGDIAEVIIFTRALKTEERQSIENYLSKKYKITLS